MTEPLAFGLSSALLFAHIPFVKVSGFPLTAYRALPGSILRGLEQRLGVRLARQRFRDPVQGKRALDDALDRGEPVGLQTSVFFLPYFPPDMQFHFNAHNLVVIGRSDNEYLISDPVFESLQWCDEVSLERARFAGGAFAPRGLMYRVKSLPRGVEYRRVVPGAIRKTVRVNLKTPLPLVGVRAIDRLAEKVRRLPEKGMTEHRQGLFVGHIIRMQEEIGTGGGGFRFMYAAFLQEAAALLQDEFLDKTGAQMIEVGDQWRQFALTGAGFCRHDGTTAREVAEQLSSCAVAERAVFMALDQWVRRRA